MTNPVVKYGSLALMLCLLALTGCGQDLGITAGTAEITAAEEDMAEAGLRFESDGKEIRLDSGYEKRFAFEHPFLTRSRKLQALRRFKQAAKDHLANEIQVKVQVVDEKILLEQEARRARSHNGSAPVEGYELTQRFLDDSLKVAIAQAELAVSGLTLKSDPELGTVKVQGIASQRKVKNFLALLSRFEAKYRHELASPLPAQYLSAIEAYLKG